MLKSLFLVLSFFSFHHLFSAPRFALPAKWPEDEELLLSVSGTLSGSSVKISISPNACWIRESFEGASSPIAFSLSELELVSLLKFLDYKRFANIKSKKIKHDAFDKPSKMLYWKKSGKVLFQAGTDRGIRVKKRHEGYFNAIVQHLFNLADQKTEVQKVDVVFELDTGLRQSGLSFGYKINGTGIKAFYHAKEIPEQLKFRFIKGNKTLYFYLSNTEKALNNENPESKWISYSFDPEESRQFKISLKDDKILIEKK